MEGQPSGRIEDYLRAPLIWWMRSAYVIEVNPWSKREQIEAALALRGAIVSADGYVETRLAELALRSSIMVEYSSLRSTFPYMRETRLAYLKEIFSRALLKPYRDTAERFFNRFDESAELRHLMAHAKMQVEPDWIVFEDFKTGNGGSITYRRTAFTFKALENYAWKSVRLSRICQHLANEIENLQIVPPLDSLQAP